MSGVVFVLTVGAVAGVELAAGHGVRCGEPLFCELVNCAAGSAFQQITGEKNSF